MGGNNSKIETEDDKRKDFANHRGPIAVHVQQSKNQDRRPIVKVPGTNTRIIHVDPTQRKDVVPGHGYIAVEHIPSWRRRTIGMKSSRSDSTQEVSFQGGNNSSSQALFSEESMGAQSDSAKQAAHLDSNLRPRGFDGNEDSVGAHSDSAKAAPHVDSGIADRAKKRRRLNEDGGAEDDPFADNAAPEHFDGTNQPGAEKAAQELNEEVGGVEFDSQPPAAEGGPQTVEIDPFAASADQQPNKQESSTRSGKPPRPPRPGAVLVDDPLHLGDGSVSPTIPVHGRGPNFGDDASSQGSGTETRSRSPGLRQGGGFGSMASGASLEAVQRKFVRPLGPHMNDRVFFIDKNVKGDHEYDGLGTQYYDLEEDEIHEMAGVQRPKESRVKTASSDGADKRAGREFEGEITSNVLDALKMAIEAPMKDFRAQDVYGEEDEDELARFRAAAMERAKDAFDAAEEENQELANAAFGSTVNLGPGGLGSGHLNATGSNLGGMTSAASMRGKKKDPGPADIDGFEDMSPEEKKKAQIKRRKQLHKELNAWKAAFQEANGRPATNMELNNDPTIRDVYKAYVKLKKETTEKKKQEEAGPPDALETTAAGMNITINPFEATDPNAGTFGGTNYGMGGTMVDATNLNVPGDHAHKLAPIPSPRDDAGGLSPGGESHNTQPVEFTKEMKKEMKTLTKEVKAWKIAFKAENGRNPTRREISGDPAISEKYLRLKELKALSGEGDDEDGKRADKTPQPEQPIVPALSPEELKQKLEEIEFEESIERRNQEADEDLDRRKLMRKIAQMPPPEPKAEDISAGDLGGQTVQMLETVNGQTVVGGGAQSELAAALAENAAPNEEEGTQENSNIEGPASFHTKPPTAHHVGGWGMGTVDDTEDEETVARRKELVDELKDWQDNFREAFDGEEPTLKDLRDAGLMDKYEEYTTLPKAENEEDQFNLAKKIDKPLVSLESQARMKKEPTVEEAQVLHKRRKELGKELSAWKAQFAEVHQKEPTSKDIKADPSVAAIYEEYQSIPKDILKQAKANAAKDLEGTKTSAHAPSLGNTLNATGFQNGLDGTGSLKPPSTSDQPGSAQDAALDADPKAQAKRRKALGKQLNAWKAQFAEENGREPTSKDIKKSEEIAPIYEEYKALQKAKQNQDENAQSGTQHEESDMPPPATIGLAPPTPGDRVNSMRGTPERGASAMLNATNNGEALSANASPQPQGLLNPKQLAKRRKVLGKQLNAWKTKFKEENSRAPTTKDMRKDPEINQVFEEYQSIPKDVAEIGGTMANFGALDEGGVGDGMGGTTRQFSPPGGTGMEGGSRLASPNGGGGGAFDAVPVPNINFERPDSSQEKIKELKKKKKALGKELNSWKQDFFEATDEKPKVEDIQKDEIIAPVYEEYLQVSKEIAELEGGSGNKAAGSGLQAPGQDEGASRPSSSVNNEGGDGKADAKRRKELGKMLNQWKADFSEAKGKAPTNRDIKKDPEAAAWLEEYNALKKTNKTGDGDGAAGVDGGLDQTVNNLGSTNNQFGGTIDPFGNTTSGNGVADGTGGDGGGLDDGFGGRVVEEEEGHPHDDGGADIGAPPVDEGRPSTAERKALKKRLTKELNAWKEQFALDNGRNPKTSDIREVPEVYALYEQLNEIKAMSS